MEDEELQAEIARHKDAESYAQSIKNEPVEALDRILKEHELDLIVLKQSQGIMDVAHSRAEIQVVKLLEKRR